MSLLSRINQPDKVPLHSSGLAGGVNNASFGQRRRQEHERTRIQPYRVSHQGSQFVARGEVLSSPRVIPRTTAKHGSRQSFNASDQSSNVDVSQQGFTRQSFNAGGGTMAFREPPARGYNPYA